MPTLAEAAAAAIVRRDRLVERFDGYSGPHLPDLLAGIVDADENREMLAGLDRTEVIAAMIDLVEGVPASEPDAFEVAMTTFP